MNYTKRLNEYYAVIFTSERTEGDNGYEEMAKEMDQLVPKQPDFLGAESARNENGYGITVSYWESLDDIKRWKENALHKAAQDKGRKEWYKRYTIRICKVEEERVFHI
ncbi:antibiotic biosynthesis monooxygenase family protein [Aeribacillus sp. FSL M8-0235]|uniref:antibiotic biosynthesis monooxygenase family protein n=1 Tax=Aeribacillus sp. FSL M8-0235 TaxID=2954576 RepID=UPI0030F7CEC1